MYNYKDIQCQPSSTNRSIIVSVVWLVLGEIVKVNFVGISRTSGNVTGHSPDEKHLLDSVRDLGFFDVSISTSLHTV